MPLQTPLQEEAPAPIKTDRGIKPCRKQDGQTRGRLWPINLWKLESSTVSVQEIDPPSQWWQPPPRDNHTDNTRTHRKDGTAGQDTQNKTRQDKTRQDKTPHQDKTGQDKTRQDKTRQHKTTQDNTRQHKGKTRQDKTRQDKKDKTRQDKTRQRQRQRQGRQRQHSQLNTS